jgi:predicted permease
MLQALELLYFSAKSVILVFAVASLGVIFVRLKLLKDKHLKLISQFIFTASLPCLLFSKVAININLTRLKELWVLPFSCVLYVFVGLLLGLLTVKLCKPKKEFSRCVVASCGFGNTGYLPMSLIVAITAFFPIFSKHENAGDLGIAYISTFLIGFSPLMWSVGYTIVSGKSIKEFTLSQLLPPPLIGLLFGLLIGLTPPLKKLICLPSGTLYPLFYMAELVAAPTIICALILLGGKLAFTPIASTINKKTIIGMVLSKLIIMPLLALFYVKFLISAQFIPNEIIIILVFIIEATVPPANNLIVMCSVIGKNEENMATLLFRMYLFCIPTTTFFIMITLYLFA